MPDHDGNVKLAGELTGDIISLFNARTPDGEDAHLIGLSVCSAAIGHILSEMLEGVPADERPPAKVQALAGVLMSVMKVIEEYEADAAAG